MGKKITWIFPVQRLRWRHRPHSCVCWGLLEGAGLVICWLHCCELYCDSVLPPATHRVSYHNTHTDLKKYELACIILIKMPRHTASVWRQLFFTSCLGLLLASRDWSLLRSCDALENRLISWFVFFITGKWNCVTHLLTNCVEGMAQLTCSGCPWIWGAIFPLVSLF